MKLSRAWLLAAAVGAAAISQVRDAAACGGCFNVESETTVVTGHKMILSISQQHTTLYDQIVYSGDPSSFAWILPVKGLADLGLSSDALFQSLDQQTSVTVSSPNLNCAPPPDCGYYDGAYGSGAGGGSTGGPVTVVAQKTVGPYETVQLNSSDPTALATWLSDHGYNLPADIQPVIDAYVNEGFDFLALKLVPGQGVSAMRPVRVTTPGASNALPLRMVAAGTGMITPITLWVLGEGRYDTVNLPSFQIDPNALVWNWDTQSSNYNQLKQFGFATTQNKGWLVQAGEPFTKYETQSELNYLVQYDPTNSGYGDGMGSGAQMEVDADLQALFGDIPDSTLWITRLTGELSRAALGADLQLGAASDQSTVNRFFTADATVGTPPACPEYPPCDPIGGIGNPSGGWGWFGNGFGGGTSGGGSSGGCAIYGGDGVPMLSGIALVAALALVRRRRAR
jgi:hypothetical protein